MMRNILDVIVGLVIGNMSIMGIHYLGIVFYPLPEGTDMKDMKITEDAIELIDKGLQQIIDYKGLIFDRAFENLTIGGFYYFMYLFHFERRRQLATFFDSYTIDKILLKNTITGDEMWLANKVAKISDEEVEKYRQ
jgi:hypothetical protein